MNTKILLLSTLAIAICGTVSGQTLEQLFQKSDAELNRSHKELSKSELQKKSEEVVEGFSVNERWAYEFIKHKVESTTTLASDSSGLIVFADSNHVVRSADFRGTVAAGSIKTELSFYDTRSGELQGLICLPNRVFQVGRVEISKEDLFYIGTVSANKYRYDDYPLALTLVNLKSRKLERIPLVQDDYWLALNNDVKILNSGNQLMVKVQPGLSGQYISQQPKNDSFSMLQVAIREVSRPEEEPDHHEINKERHISFVKNDIAALSYLGAAPVESKYPEETRGTFAVGSEFYRTGYPNLLKLDYNGNLRLIDIMTLREQVFNVGRKDASNPHIFSDGSLACIADPNLHLFRGQEAVKIPLPQTDDRPDAPAVKIAYLEQSVGYQVGNEFFKARIPGALQFDRVSLSDRALAKMQEAIRRGDVEGLSEEEANEILKKSPSEVVQDWEPASDTFVVSGGGFLEWFRVDAETGEPIGPLLSGGAGGFYGGIKYSNASSGWRSYSFINDSHTGGFGACLNLEQVGSGRDPITVAQDLPNIAEPLSIKALEGKCLILYGAEDSVNLVSVDLVSGGQKPIKAWHFPGRFGMAICDHKSGTLFIPTAAGFEVWSIWNENPSKRFDLVLGDDDQYAILLPNGIYAGSPGCETLLRLNAGIGTVDGSSLAQWRNRPAEVLKALGGDPAQIELLAKVTERWQKRIGFDFAKPEPKASDLPKVSVPERPPLWANGNEAVFTIRWEKGASPLKRVVARVNGVESVSFKDNAFQDSSEKKGSIEAKVKLAEGQNWVEVAAEDMDGHRSDLQRFRTILSKAAKPTKRYIIAMGVSKYRDSALDLEFAAKDATDLAAAIKESTKGESEVLLLTNEEATKDSPAKIREFLATATENDEVVAFCAGHGVLDSNLDYVYASHEFNPANPSETGVKLDELVDAIGSSKSLKRLLLLDTCHSGQVGEKDEMLLAQMNTELPKGVRAVKQRGMSVKPVEGLSAEGQQRFIEEMFLLPGLHRGINIIGASGGAEFALESAQWNNGVFTASIIEALREKKADLNEDDRVSVGELRNYLAQRVSELTKGAQKPSVVAAERDQDFDLIRAAYKRPAPPLEQPASHTEAAAPTENSHEGLQEFFDSWMTAHQSNNPDSLAAHYADQVAYCYEKAITPRAKIRDGIARLMTGFPARNYTDLAIKGTQPDGDGGIKINYSYRYAYSGKKNVRGKADVSITLQKIDGEWKITRFDEKTTKL
jgi:uncharacterized caspase-like protein